MQSRPLNRKMRGLRSETQGYHGAADGHNILNRHLNVMGLTEAPECKFCERGEGESSLHLLTHCAALWRQRFEIFRLGYPTPEAIKEATIGEILFFSRKIGLT